MTAHRVPAALESPLAERATNVAACVEDQWFDRKSLRIKPRDLGRIMTAFANAEGGVVAIGTNELSTEDPDVLLRERQQAAVDFTVPPVRAHVSLVECRLEGDSPGWISIIDVESSEGAHETQDGTCYLRIGDETRKLNFMQRHEMHFDKGQSSFDGQPAREASVDDLDATRLDAHMLLTNRALLTRAGTPTNAGVLLFGKTPQLLLPNSDLRLLKIPRPRSWTRSHAVLGRRLRREGRRHAPRADRGSGDDPRRLGSRSPSTRGGRARSNGCP